MIRFEVNNLNTPAPFVYQLSGTAYMKRKSTRFFMTISPFFIALSVEPKFEGLKLIACFTREIGEPTLKYRDRNEYYEDYTAEWHLSSDARAIVRRIQGHLALGFTPEELP